MVATDWRQEESRHLVRAERRLVEQVRAVLARLGDDDPLHAVLLPHLENLEASVGRLEALHGRPPVRSGHTAASARERRPARLRLLFSR